MPRPKRDDFPGARHHVMSRGARKQCVFRDAQHCEIFLEALSHLPTRFAVTVHGYALMPNHFHLMLESGDGRLSRAMAYLLARYTVESNRLHGWDGPVFKGRFHSRPVYADEHWMHLLAYLHLNPIRARLEMRLGQYRWTSHQFYSVQKPPNWLTTGQLHEMLEPFGGYSEYVKEARSKKFEPPDGFDGIVFEARRTFEEHTPGRSMTEQKATPIPANIVLERVARAAGCQASELKLVRTGRAGNPGRIVAAHALVYTARLNHRETATLLDMSVTDVSRCLLKVRQVRPAQTELLRILEQWEEWKGI
jgi:REP element-mobilizing transposase RayT